VIYRHGCVWCGGRHICKKTIEIKLNISNFDHLSNYVNTKYAKHLDGTSKKIANKHIHKIFRL
jgi:hypothetical protein